MPRSTIADMGKVPVQYRPSRVLERFETLSEMKAEDRKRAALLSKHRHEFKKKDRKAIKRLVDHLLADEKQRAQRSCASAVDMRFWRNRWPGWLAAHCAAEALNPVFVTLQPNTWLVPTDQLATIDPHRLMQQIRNDLNYKGARDAGGGILLGLDCEYEPTHGNFVFHVHGWAWGDMRKVINNLRKQKKYAHNPEALDEGSGAVYPIRCNTITETPLSCATYIGKSYWPERALTTRPNGISARPRDKQRIKGRPHTEMLLWLHRQRYPKLFLTMKLRVTRAGFKPWD